MPRKDNDTITNYKGYHLVDKPTELSTKKLDNVIDIIDTATMRHCKVLITRFDLRFPKEMNADCSNKPFTKVMNNFTKGLNQNKIDVQYIAKREQVNSKNPHYHVGVIIDGNKRCNHNNIIRDVEHHWANAIGLSIPEVKQKQLVYPCNKDPQGNARPNGYMLKHNSKEFQANKASAVKQLSYLCKVDSNDITPSKTRKFFVSQYRQDYSRAEERKAYYYENSQCLKKSPTFGIDR